MDQKQKNAIVIITLSVLAIIFFNSLTKPLSITGTVGFKEFRNINTAEQYVTYQVIAFPDEDRGVVLYKTMAKNGEIKDLGFGETVLNADYTGIQKLKYTLTNIKIDGLKAIMNYQTAHEIEYSDVRVVDAVGFCDLSTGSCMIESARLKAYDDFGNDVTTSSNFYGITKITANFIALKEGVVIEPTSETSLTQGIANNNFVKFVLVLIAIALVGYLISGRNNGK